MELFHFSENDSIDVFTPRPVKIPSSRPEGMEWLNGPLVWAIDAWHQPMYLFPRDCPRILFWPLPTTTAEDRGAYWPSSSYRMVACIEESWLDRFSEAVLYRYALPRETFEPLHDAGMWVSRSMVKPLAVDKVENFPAVLAASQVELRVMPSLAPLRDMWRTSLHVSGIRLRNARGFMGEAS